MPRLFGFLFCLLLSLAVFIPALHASTPTFTVTDTPTFTVTDTPTLTYTPTITPTSTITPTLTITPTITPTSTITPTFTISPTITPTYTITLTSTITPTSTISPTITMTPTSTEVINRIVSVNHNYFNPLEGQTLEINNLNTSHGEVTIRIFTQSGILIKNLLHQEQITAGQVPVWDGRNTGGEAVASGVYIIMVNGKKLHKRFRVAVIK